MYETMKGYAAGITFCDPVVRRYVYLVMAAALLYVYCTKVDARRADAVQRWAMNGLESSSGVLGTLWSMGVNYFNTNMGIVDSVMRGVTFDFLINLNDSVDFISLALGKVGVAASVAWVMCTVVTQMYNLTALTLRYPLLATGVGVAAVAMRMYGSPLAGGKRRPKRRSPRRSRG